MWARWNGLNNVDMRNLRVVVAGLMTSEEQGHQDQWDGQSGEEDGSGNTINLQESPLTSDNFPEIFSVSTEDLLVTRSALL